MHTGGMSVSMHPQLRWYGLKFRAMGVLIVLIFCGPFAGATLAGFVWYEDEGPLMWLAGLPITLFCMLIARNVLAHTPAWLRALSEARAEGVGSGRAAQITMHARPVARSTVHGVELVFEGTSVPERFDVLDVNVGRARRMLRGRTNGITCIADPRLHWVELPEGVILWRRTPHQFSEAAPIARWAGYGLAGYLGITLVSLLIHGVFLPFDVHEQGKSRLLSEFAFTFRDPDAISTRGEPILRDAIIAERDALARLLVRKGANVNLGDPKYQLTPLMTAVMMNRYELAKFLLANGAAVDALDRKANTALDHALGNHRPRFARLMLEHGADPNLIHDDARGHRIFRKLSEMDPETFRLLVSRLDREPWPGAGVAGEVGVR